MLSDQTNIRKELNHMNIIPQNLRYLPHDLTIKFKACSTYSTGLFKVREICRLYHISKASLMRWMKRFDGTKESLINKSKRPLTPHPNSHKKDEIKNIFNLLKRNPGIGLSELYGKLKQKYSYTRHPASLFRFLRKNGVYVQPEAVKSNYVPKPYSTPLEAGKKMQLDVKFVPNSCYTGSEPNKFYQYTMIDEATRERFIYAYNERSSYTTVDFILKALVYFGYIPECIQTDNGLEFTRHKDSKESGLHLFDRLCLALNIKHKLIKPYTPRHNGKVERSHRNDQKRFYNKLQFYSLDDLRHQMKLYLKRSNNIPSSSLNWLSPIEKRKSLISIKHNQKSLIKNIDLNNSLYLAI